MDMYHKLYLNLAPKNLQFPPKLSVMFLILRCLFNFDLFKTGSLFRQRVLNHHYPKSDHNTWNFFLIALDHYPAHLCVILLLLVSDLASLCHLCLTPTSVRFISYEQQCSLYQACHREQYPRSQSSFTLTSQLWSGNQ